MSGAQWTARKPFCDRLSIRVDGHYLEQRAAAFYNLDSSFAINEDFLRFHVARATLRLASIHFNSGVYYFVSILVQSRKSPFFAGEVMLGCRFCGVCLIALGTMLVEWPSIGTAQQLTGMGMMATGTVSRTRIGGNNFEVGDMMYVTVLHPANSGEMSVSAHMEYQDAQQRWVPVPTAKSSLGMAYLSGKYPGLRDYVKFDGQKATTTRHICLFMPYDAAALPGSRVYQRRYVIRVWDNENRDIANTVLPADQVSTKRDADGTLTITVVKVKTCSSMVDATNSQPIPESEDAGSVRFFSTNNGKWVCPGNE